MNDHDLLIEIHTDVKHIKEWSNKHEDQHEKEKASRWKWLAPIYAAVVGILAKVIFWN